MCSRFQSVTNAISFERCFGIPLPGRLGYSDVRAGSESVFIKRSTSVIIDPATHDIKESAFGFFGLTPHLTASSDNKLQTFNTSFETLAANSSFSAAWKNSSRCIIPALAIYEPDWRTGHPRDTRISRADGRPLAIGGLWWTIHSPDGRQVHCFTMLTVAADGYPPMQNLLRPGDPKRMVVVLPDDGHAEWLAADPQASEKFMQLYPANKLVIESNAL